MARIKQNSVRLSAMVALICLSLACFTYINSIQLENPNPEKPVFVEEIGPNENEVLPDVELIKRIVRKAFEFMSMTNL